MKLIQILIKCALSQIASPSKLAGSCGPTLVGLLFLEYSSRDIKSTLDILAIVLAIVEREVSLEQVLQPLS